jgi:acetyltransferase-like isoleucine patch superfamily enzyme
MNKYHAKIKQRSTFGYLKGLLPRVVSFVWYSYISWLARRKGASIGINVTMPYSLARKANHNLIVGDHTVIQTDNLDLRAPVHLGRYVIIGLDVEILTCSHHIDSMEWEFKPYGIVIEDYAWVATRVFILPSCRKISHGAVCGAGSVVGKNVEQMSIVSGNPAAHLKYRLIVHSDIIVESLLGNDLLAYINARK